MGPPVVCFGLSRAPPISLVSSERSGRKTKTGPGFRTTGYGEVSEWTERTCHRRHRGSRESDTEGQKSCVDKTMTQVVESTQEDGDGGRDDTLDEGLEKTEITVTV